jgi:hypothetical protein
MPVSQWAHVTCSSMLSSRFSFLRRAVLQMGFFNFYCSGSGVIWKREESIVIRRCSCAPQTPSVYSPDPGLKTAREKIRGPAAACQYPLFSVAKMFSIGSRAEAHPSPFIIGVLAPLALRLGKI